MIGPIVCVCVCVCVYIYILGRGPIREHLVAQGRVNAAMEVHISE